MNHQLLIEIKNITDAAHSQADDNVKGLKKACQKGCDSCCHQIVDVFTWEEPKIFEYILLSLDRKMKRQISKNLTKWFGVFNKNTREANRENPLTFQEIRQVQHYFRENRVPCPFLLESQCSIYEARPMLCRVHYAKESADECKSNPHRTTPNNAQEIFHNSVKSFKPDVYPVATKPLSYLVAGELGEGIKSKPMHGILYDPKNIFGRI